MVDGISETAEYIRMQENKDKKKHWRKWGPYLAERQWGTIREDYSVDGNAWEYFTHHQSRYRTYRWGEDGLGGISDNHQNFCFAFALWNRKDRILKERMFGLTGPEGNHGEDVKEYYYYLDSTPSHAYMKYLYKYPQTAYPYDQLRTENRSRSTEETEFELADTGIFDNNKYFDIFMEYAKKTDQDLFIKVTITNQAETEAPLTLLGQGWFRNTWRWKEDGQEPVLEIGKTQTPMIKIRHQQLGTRYLYCHQSKELIFTNNETNTKVLYNDPNKSMYTKEAFHRYIINDFEEAINPEQTGTKAAAVYEMRLDGGETREIYFRLTDTAQDQPFEDLEEIFQTRIEEANEFYDQLLNKDSDQYQIQRQAFAGMLWGKQFYHYVVKDWLEGDPAEIRPPTDRLNGRNSDWMHVHAEDILSMPDTWEYPWFAAWDSAFQLVPLVMIDPEFAKRQLLLYTREWYMHPSGAIPAYEWDFGDTNPPVQAYSAWKIYKMESEIYQTKDVKFLERVFQKLLLNFTWFVNKLDFEGKNIFQGGFLGLDNIGVFDRSHPLPTGGHLEQADGTAWMAMYSLNMMRIALELAQHNSAYEDIASKFFEHFIRIAHSIKTIGHQEGREGLWDVEDEFFYDILHYDNGGFVPLKIRSIIGLIPLFAVEVLEGDILQKVPDFNRRMHWFIENRDDLAGSVACESDKPYHRHLFSIVRQQRLQPILKRVFDEEEFLSDYGIRSLSKHHLDYPFIIKVNGEKHSVAYEPAESTSSMFGGNSNWRGPIWFPINYLFIESLHEFHTYYDQQTYEFPTGSGNYYDLDTIANQLRKRLTNIFLQDENGKRVVFDSNPLHKREGWDDTILFFEYFNGDTGAGLGASHQTGWTGLIAEMIYRLNHPYLSDPSF